MSRCNLYLVEHTKIPCTGTTHCLDRSSDSSTHFVRSEQALLYFILFRASSLHFEMIQNTAAAQSLNYTVFPKMPFPPFGEMATSRQMITINFKMIFLHTKHVSIFYIYCIIIFYNIASRSSLKVRA